MNKILYLILSSHLWTSDNFSDLRIRSLFYFISLSPWAYTQYLIFNTATIKNNGVQPNVKPENYLKKEGYGILDK